MTTTNSTPSSKEHSFPETRHARIGRVCSVCGVHATSPHAKAPCAVTTEIRTGLEGKSMRAVIENWLYCTEDKGLQTDCEKELRKRFTRAFPRPEWAKGRRL